MMAAEMEVAAEVEAAMIAATMARHHTLQALILQQQNLPSPLSLCATNAQQAQQ